MTTSTDSAAAKLGAVLGGVLKEWQNAGYLPTPPPGPDLGGAEVRWPICIRCSWPRAICPCITDADALPAATARVRDRHKKSVARARATDRADRLRSP